VFLVELQLICADFQLICVDLQLFCAVYCSVIMFLVQRKSVAFQLQISASNSPQISANQLHFSCKSAQTSAIQCKSAQIRPN
jgi:hypothetical protein